MQRHFCLRKMHDTKVKHCDRPKTNQIAVRQRIPRGVHAWFGIFFINFSRIVYCYCYGGATNMRDNWHEFSEFFLILTPSFTKGAFLLLGKLKS